MTIINEVTDRPPKRRKYIPSDGGTTPDLKRSRCPSCGEWRMAEYMNKPCEECIRADG